MVTKSSAVNCAPAIAQLIELTSSDMKAVNELILAKIASQVELIPVISEHLFSAGGKRLRPMLTLLAARMFGYEGAQHISLAMAVEFMHSATLLHDDVVDESDLRRGLATARKLWGNQASVLVGDFLLGQAFKTLVDVGSIAALKVLSQAAAIIAEGEVMQLSAVKDMSLGEQHYFKIIEAKTAILFSAACEVGPIIAGAKEEERQALKSYGLYLGMVFQLIDDILDYSGDSAILGKNIGDDFREGKITLPIIACYERADIEDKRFLAQALANREESAWPQLLALLDKYQALNYALAKAKAYADDARLALKPLKDNIERRALLDIIDFCIDRIY